MAHEHKLEIFRGRWKFKNNIQKIWGVLLFLTIVTAVEVVLGIYKPAMFMSPFIAPFEPGFFGSSMNVILSPFIYMKPLNLIFIVLTLVKAYYIAWDFMHLRDETKGLRRAIVWTPVFLIAYLVFILLAEAGYIYDILGSEFVKWNF
ncbi:cytochrome C oxidase subunit IV family protein [Cellulophaga sp. F20128]|uniref:cytochrome C oxidase subunit IV family protein n=1 Tax=Cellulophaga sp. F20128 TaxID=2926413 RepID=UPI001FF2B47C|nr:cytochrome C oxidase subunit IV family protein [Cellulophaga sp. F20128]MCK0155557.1 cytochrome C oxidase subunit IV family protein [Cellulophaga sp. F20128]